MQKPGRNRKQGGGNRRRKVAEEKYREDRRQMGKTILLVSREEMLHQAHNILQEKKYTIHGMRVISTENAVMEARKAIADGASIIIARGLQASLIKQYTDIPVVEIVLTAQEMALLVMRARQIVAKSRPVIAVVGFRNMFCDMSYFDELSGIDLRMYFADQGAQLPGTVRRAVEDGVDLVIGGDTAVSIATEAGVPSLFLSTTEDSMRQAMAMAENLDYAMKVEKKTAAQMETLLDYSFSGVIRLDSQGLITAVNPVMEDIIGKKQEQLKGLFGGELAPLLGEEVLRQVLKEGKDSSLFLEWNHTPVFAVIAPVLYEERVEGAIITCHKTAPRAGTKEKRQEQRRKQEERGLPPLVRFEDILQGSPAMQECVRLASLYALSRYPVVLRGEPGTEKRMLAESIHNSSPRKEGPFLDIPCRGLSGEEQRDLIFGSRGAALQAQGGTLLLRNAEELTLANQYRLCQLIRFQVCHGADIARMRKIDVRIMITIESPLPELEAEGKISSDLYFLLSGLELFIPPLRERKEDLKRKLDMTLQSCCERYGRFHVLTAGARAVMMEYPWRGNLFQVENFCERLILTAGKRSIDENTVKRLLGELYPEPSVPDRALGLNLPGEGTLEEEPEELRRIRVALKKYNGNREKTAEELGISKTTLWRKMKLWGIA